MAREVNNKNDLIREVAINTGASIRQTEDTINAFLQLMQEKMLAGEVINIKGFFGMKSRRAKSKVIRDFEAGTQKQSGERTLPKCKFSETFVQKIKSKGSD